MPVRIAPAPPTAVPALREEERYVPKGPDPGAEPLFSAIVPAYNEGASLEAAVRGLVAAFEEVGEPFEILVVDDGSRDGSGASADALAESDARVRAFHHPRNLGLGAAIRTAVEASRGTYLVGSPVDSPLDAGQIQAFHETMEPQAAFAYLPGKAACDVAVGYRIGRPGYGAFTRFASWGYRWMMRIGFLTFLRDFNWICMYRRSVFDKVRFEADDFIALPEILFRAKRAGLVLKQVPCPMQARRHGRGTVGRPRMLVQAFTGITRLWLKLTFGR